jgi:hypothetical protein
MQEKENVLRIFKETKEAIERGDIVKIENLSNQTINTSSLSQDPDNITVAVLVYSLSKIIQRTNYKKIPGWPTFYNTYITGINNIIQALEKNDDISLKKNLENMRNALNKVSGKLKQYISDVFRKASINKASNIYSHGLSMENTAKLLGITLFELASYAGQKGIVDNSQIKTIGVKSRINLAMEMFK